MSGLLALDTTVFCDQPYSNSDCPKQAKPTTACLHYSYCLANLKDSKDMGSTQNLPWGKNRVEDVSQGLSACLALALQDIRPFALSLWYEFPKPYQILNCSPLCPGPRLGVGFTQRPPASHELLKGSNSDATLQPLPAHPFS